MSSAGTGLVFSLGLVVAVFSSAQAPRPREKPAEAQLKIFLRKYLYPREEIDRSTRIIAATTAERDPRGTEVVVYVSGQSWCGSGGCTLLIVEARGHSYAVLGRVPTVRLPVRVLTTWSFGHPDLGVTVQGGGILEPHEARLVFDGRRYPGIATTAPANAHSAGVSGVELIGAGAQGEPLF